MKTFLKKVMLMYEIANLLWKDFIKKKRRVSFLSCAETPFQLVERQDLSCQLACRYIFIPLSQPVPSWVLLVLTPGPPEVFWVQGWEVWQRDPSPIPSSGAGALRCSGWGVLPLVEIIIQQDSHL